MYETSTVTTTTSTVDSAAVAGIFIITLLIALIAYAIFAWLLGRIFQKAGQAQWKAWVPLYNTWVFLEIGGQKGFWAVLMLVPLINFVSLIFTIIAAVNIGKRLGKHEAFVLLYLFFTPVWLLWLAFDNSTWQGADASQAETAFDVPSQPAQQPTQQIAQPPQTPPEAQPQPPQQTPPTPPQNFIQ